MTDQRTASRQIRAIHANDPEWIIQLWLAIHGGDPAPFLSKEAINKAALGAIKALTPYLEPGRQRAVTAALG